MIVKIVCHVNLSTVIIVSEYQNSRDFIHISSHRRNMRISTDFVISSLDCQDYTPPQNYVVSMGKCSVTCYSILPPPDLHCGEGERASVPPVAEGERQQLQWLGEPGPSLRLLLLPFKPRPPVWRVWLVGGICCMLSNQWASSLGGT